MKDQRRQGDPWHLRLAWHPLALPVAFLAPIVIGLAVCVIADQLGVYVWWLA